MNKFYFYSEKNIQKTIREMFLGFEIHIISQEKIFQNDLINQNILLITKGEFLEHFNKSFFLNNNVVIFFTENKNTNYNNISKVKFLTKVINVNKFVDEVKTCFVSNSFNYGDIKISGEKIINNKTEKETYLTTLEKNILALLIDNKKIDKNSLLEIVLKVKKNTETKTLESHFTRIRNKLLKINSNLKILSKDNKVFLTY